ncbi:MAG: hypothetical protein EBU90_02115 [Proteobacteria bacterium]|nr:hypothetical protein [Pseudomonadota bacterium]
MLQLLHCFLFVMTCFAERCTMHDYEGDQKRFGVAAYDNQPPWCGQKYSNYNVSRIMAMSIMTRTNCDKCFLVTGEKSVYILGVDKKADPGLDIARSSFVELFPNSDPLNPQDCSFVQVPLWHCTQSGPPPPSVVSVSQPSVSPPSVSQPSVVSVSPPSVSPPSVSPPSVVSVSPPSVSLPSVCSNAGYMRCNDDGGYSVCNNGIWINMICAPGTTCRKWDHWIICDV